MHCRRWIPCLIALVAPLAGSVARGGDPIVGAIASLPEDTMAFLVTPSLKHLDADYQQALVDLQLQAMTPPPFNSLVGALKSWQPALAGLDENGPIAVVFLPITNLMEINTHQVIVLPVTDPKAMLEGLGGKAGDDKVWDVTFVGQPSFATTADKRVYLCRSREVALKMASMKAGLDARLKPTELKSLEGLDLALWIDTDRLLKVLKPQIDMMTAMMVGMQASSGPFGAKQAESTKKQIDHLVEGMTSLLIGVSLDKAGLDLRLGTGIRPGSELAKQSKSRTTNEPLLRGLPADQFVMAFGTVLHPEYAGEAAKQIDMYAEMLTGLEGVDKAKADELKKLILDALGLPKAMRVSVEALPPGDNGVFAVSVIVETGDAKRSIDLQSKIIELGKSIASEVKVESAADEVKVIASAVTFTADAESIGGKSIAHLKIDLSKIPDVDEDDLEGVTKLIGKDGLTVRVAAINPSTTVTTVGGGAAYMERLIQSASKNEPALESIPSVKKSASAIPAERSGVVYVAADRLIGLINQAMKAVDEEELPVSLPAGTSPIAMASTGGEDWGRMDLFVPTDLMLAGKNAAMVMMGTGAVNAAPPPPEAPK